MKVCTLYDKSTRKVIVTVYGDVWCYPSEWDLDVSYGDPPYEVDEENDEVYFVGGMNKQ